MRLVDNIHDLHEELSSGTYRHGAYYPFKISDPKPRDIHKALVRDRLLHHALYRKLYPFFNRTWISDSFSCRIGKGTHRAMDRFRFMARKVSKNDTKTCWVLKCDIKKFFASIDHEILLSILREYVTGARTMALLERVIESFSTTSGKGLPLGNLTSQLLVNVYMNEFDQFVKHALKEKWYIRYADDFVVLSHDRKRLEEILPIMSAFLQQRLALSMHPQKVSIGTLAVGVDFLGWVHFIDHRVLRTASKRRMVRTLNAALTPDRSRTSYIGLLSHGNAHKLSKRYLSKKEYA